MYFHKIIKQHPYFAMKMRKMHLLCNLCYRRHLSFKTYRILLIFNQEFNTSIKILHLIQIHMKNILNTSSMYNNRQRAEPPNSFRPICISVSGLKRPRKRPKTPFLVHYNLFIFVNSY